jgi:UDP-N-acetyl-2-amino-2-deoxyglucuronate dehydrogenase
MREQATQTTVLLVGAGAYGAVHAAAIAQSDRLRLVGVVDHDGARAEELAQLHGVASWTRFDEALAILQPTVVAVAVPTVAHIPVALRAISAGAHVMLEKPICRPGDDATQLLNAAGQAGRIVDVVSQRRFQEANLRLKDVIVRGGLGQIGSASCDTSVWRTEEYFATAPWRGRAALGGGNLLNHGLHALDLLVWFLGGIDGVVAFSRTSRFAEVDVEESLAAALRFESGCVATLQASLVANPGGRMEIVLTGDEATATVSDGGVVLTRRSDDGSTTTETWNSGDTDEALRLQYEELDAAIRTGSRLRVGLQSALDTLDAATAILNSADGAGSSVRR